MESKDLSVTIDKDGDMTFTLSDAMEILSKYAKMMAGLEKISLLNPFEPMLKADCHLS